VKKEGLLRVAYGCAYRQCSSTRSCSRRPAAAGQHARIFAAEVANLTDFKLEAAETDRPSARIPEGVSRQPQRLHAKP